MGLLRQLGLPLLRVLVALIALASTVVAAPLRLGLTVPAGAKVEGSVGHGGMQPDYLVDLEDAQLVRLLRYADRVARGGGDDWSKADQIARYVRTRVFVDRRYDSLPYQELMRRYRWLGRAVPIGEYVRIAAGVCREHALLTHLLLERAGIRSRYLYAEVEQPGKIEDHALVLVERKGEPWVVDAFNPHFHGRRLTDLRSRAGIDAGHAVAPGANRPPLELGRFRVRKLHRFPLVSPPRARG